MTTWFTRPRFAVGAAIAVAAATGTAGWLTAASGGPIPGVTHTSCSSSSPCLDVQNFGTGRSIQGSAKSTSGIVGITHAPSTSSGPAKVLSGVRGVDLSMPFGSGTNFSSGVVGTSATGFGITGFSNVHAGVVGLTNNPSMTDGYGSAGVEGFDNSVDGGQNNVGVEGGTVGGTGVFGFSTLGNGVRGITTNPSSANGQHRAAVFGIDFSTDGGGLNFGLAGFSPGTGVAGISVAAPTAPGAPIAPAVAAVCENGGAAIQAVDGFLPTSNLLMTLDCMGNLTVKGTVTSGGPLMIASKSAAGPDVAAYASRQTEPTIEDFGEARVVNGKTHVSINRDFGKTMDQSAAYLVFITPEGDSRGLFIENKTLAGFDVRESQSGSSSLAFAYRIVARPLGSHDARLPTMSAVFAREAAGARPRGVNLRAALQQLGVGNLASSQTSPR
jgi:hypothetical protein